MEHPDHTEPLEMHIHGDVPCKPGLTTLDIESALSPLVEYTKRHYAAQGGASLYDQEPGIQFTQPDNILRFCWSVAGDIDFRETLDELVMSLNEISIEGAALEVSFYDLEFDEEEWDENSTHDSSGAEEEDNSRDDFFVLFVGPTPAAIMQVQRDLLVRDVTMLMERHFEKDEMTPVVEAMDRMWESRYNALLGSIKFPTYAKSNTLGGNGSNGSHGFGGHSGRKPRHSH